MEKSKKIIATENSCNISNNSYDTKKLKFDDYQLEINSYKIKDLKTNPYLEEQVAILNNFSKLQK